jgi:MFS-type transporter involved in bile tolerance (Atg22 family)
MPLYLPELFPTRVRATGQGLSFNFGRILTAVGALSTGQLVGIFGSYPRASSAITLIYLIGLIVIWFAPETKGRPLPD